jgi:DNA-binding MarR family transcriptional regulator
MLEKREPLNRELNYLSRLYHGVINRKLSALEVERYYYILILLKEGRGKITPKGLAEKIHSDKVFIVKILDYLYDKGIISKKVNEADRRQYFISLTEKGKKLVPAIEKAFKTTTEEAFKGLKKGEKEIYYKVVETIKGNLLSLSSNEIETNIKKSKNRK